ncbi:hypothetical protein EYF80_032524 [Liparis tanakae]|uniref:Uncharacterized protein n=1 Tax=Liparis tanakae TaxID=230148 RepID=A0A4Z2GVZ0_9TELE|nr:hypothetical protein EYF80_032524 [Liparis tanakae]
MSWYQNSSSPPRAGIEATTCRWTFDRVEKFKLYKEMNGAFKGAHVGLKKERDFVYASETIK